MWWPWSQDKKSQVLKMSTVWGSALARGWCSSQCRYAACLGSAEKVDLHQVFFPHRHTLVIIVLGPAGNPGRRLCLEGGDGFVDIFSQTHLYMFQTHLYVLHMYSFSHVNHTLIKEGTL